MEKRKGESVIILKKRFTKALGCGHWGTMLTYRKSISDQFVVCRRCFEILNRKPDNHNYRKQNKTKLNKVRRVYSLNDFKQVKVMSIA